MQQWITNTRRKDVDPHRSILPLNLDTRGHEVRAVAATLKPRVGGRESPRDADQSQKQSLKSA